MSRLVRSSPNGLAAAHAPNTVRRVADVTRAVFRVGVERGYLTTSPQQAVKLPRRAQARTITIHPLTHGELDQLVAHLPERDRTPPSSRRTRACARASYGA